MLDVHVIDKLWSAYKEIELTDRGEEAIKLLDQGIDLSKSERRKSDYYKLALAKGRELVALGGLQEAAAIFKRLDHEASLDSEVCVQAESRRRLAQLSLKHIIEEDPIELCKSSLRLAEQDGSTDEIANSLQSLGALLVHLGQSAEGVRYLNEALKVRPQSGPALFSLAKVHAFYGHHGLALELLEESSALPPFTSITWKTGITVVRAWILSLAGKHADAIPLYEQLVEKAKPFEVVENTVLLSKSLLSVGQVGKARQLLLGIVEAHKEDREYPHALIHLAECERILGNLELALKYIAEVNDHQSILRPVITTEYLLEKSKIYGLLGKYEEAYAAREGYDKLVEEAKSGRLDENLLLSQTLLERERRRHAEDLRKKELEVLEGRLSGLMNQLVRSSEEVNRAIELVTVQLASAQVPSNALAKVKQTLKTLPKKFGPARFLAEFDATYPSFRRILKQEFPRITSMQLVISCTVRIDLSVAESARLLSLSERNIENHRYRLRKLFGLKTEEKLSDFLQKF